MSKEELNEKIIVLKNYCNVLKKKNQINKDTIERNQKLILMQKDEIDRLKKIISESKDYIENQQLHKIQDTTGGLTYNERKLLEILKGDKE